jgi:plasmid stabilization system protein ParE
MTRRVVVTPRAQRQILRALRWWARNRDKAPEGLEEDWVEALALVGDSPHVGKFSSRQRLGIVRRVELDRSRYYLFYRINTNGDIDILQLWHASRRPPRG